MTDPVRLSGGAPGRSGESGATPRSGGLLSACRELADKELRALLASMFDSADDALFELADKSVNNAEQARYFDAMREVRLKRSGLERRFSEACARHFAPHTPAVPAPMAVASPAEGGLTLSLVANDDLEETLAVSNMVAKLDATGADELHALDQRMAKLVDRAVDGDEPVNPLAPRYLCEAFREACDELEAGIEVKLLILKLFDKFVVSALPRFYHEINAFLVREGILPTVRGRTAGNPVASRGNANRAPRAPGAPGAAGASGDAAGMPGGGFVGGPGDTLHDGPVVGGGVVGGGVVGGSGAAAMGGTGGGGWTHGGGIADPFPAVGPATGGTILNGVPAQELLATLQSVMTAQGARALSGQAAAGGDAAATLAMLTQIQHGGMVAAAGADGGEGGTHLLDPALLAAGTTNILREIKQTPVANAMGEVDGMMIDIVAMLFDSILDDPAIPAPMKGLIGRLQIPVLKVAILDKTFFARKFHPARQLLNALADAALGAAEDVDERDPLYVKIDALVHRILDEFDDDVRVFKEAASELEAFRASEQREAEARVEQTLDEMQAQERLRFAREVAAEQVMRHLSDAAVPVIVREFLDIYWKSFLQLAYIEGGEEGDEWVQGVATMDDLMWSLSAKQEPAERERLKRLLPTLPARLKAGMSRVPMPQTFSDRFMAALVRLHLAAIRGGAETAATPTAGPADASAPEAGDTAAAAVAQADGEPEEPGAAAAPPPEAAGPPALGEQAGFFDPTGTTEAATSEHFDADDDSIVDDDVDDDGARLTRAFERANQAIFDMARARPECEGMGTTLVAARFEGERITMAHVGDSRLYRLRDGELAQLTSDHSLRQQLVDQGFLTPEEARTSTRKNYITRAVGIDSTVVTDIGSDQIAPGDVYLLCSDGLCDMVEDIDMTSILAAHPDDLDAAAEALVAQANDNGGKDNISVILVAAPETLPTADAGEPGWRMSALSDVGRTRAHNEDHVGCDATAGVAVLADGMGGYNAGEVASELAVEAVMTMLGAHYPAAADEADTQAPDDATERTQPEGGFPDIDTMLFGSVDEQAALSAPAEQGEGTLPGDILTDEADFEEIEITDAGLTGGAVDEDEHLYAARALKIGSWVEFTHEPGKVVRARLTWVSAVTGGYLFTNRKGLRVADTTPQGLAVEFRRGTARPLETVPLFDRAVSSLMDRLHGDGSDPWA